MITRVIAQCPASDLSKHSFNVRLGSTLVKVKGVKLLAAVIPNTHSNIEENRTDQLTVRIGATTETVTIPYGNYNFFDLATALQGALGEAFPGGSFALAYDERRFTATLGSALDFSILPGRRSFAHLLGFTELPTSVQTQHTGNSAVRLNSNRWITLSLDVPGLTPLQIPAIHSTASFLLPTYSQATEISYLNSNDIGPQDIELPAPIDMASFEVKLTRTDQNRPFQLSSDTSFLFEFDHDA